MKKILFVLITLLLTLNIFSQTQVRILGKDDHGNNKFVLTNGNGEIVMMDVTHHEIYKGCHFYFSNNSTTADNIISVILRWYEEYID